MSQMLWRKKSRDAFVNLALGRRRIVKAQNIVVSGSWSHFRWYPKCTRGRTVDWLISGNQGHGFMSNFQKIHGCIQLPSSRSNPWGEKQGACHYWSPPETALGWSQLPSVEVCASQEKAGCTSGRKLPKAQALPWGFPAVGSLQTPIPVFFPIWKLRKGLKYIWGNSARYSRIYIFYSLKGSSGNQCTKSLQMLTNTI